jgi:hypothetical protein
VLCSNHDCFHWKCFRIHFAGKMIADHLSGVCAEKERILSVFLRQHDCHDPRRDIRVGRIFRTVFE